MVTDRSKKSVYVRSALLILLSLLPLFSGQKDRELLPPDDLREVEVAREMYAGGDYVIPHLAGLPFVEKPPGFQAVVASAYVLAGGPSARAARFTSAGFAFLSLVAVFLLGRHILGIEGGALAVAFLAFSQRFLRTGHLVLLDNGLAAAVAFAVLFAWLALEARTPERKRVFSGAAAFSLGVSFLFKGFVGMTIFGSGFLCYLFLSGRLGELRSFLRPLPVMAFLLPVSLWVVPFLVQADGRLLKEFFIANHFGRFMTGYISPQRPSYFYLKNIMLEFLPGSVLLPPAAVMAWKRRKEPENQAGLFLLSLFLGPFLVLSLSVAKDFVYFLPVYPALALLIAWYAVPAWEGKGRGVALCTWLMAGLAVPAAGVMAAGTVVLGTGPAVAAGIGLLFALCASGCLVAVLRGSPPWAAVWAATLLAFGWCLWFNGPIARFDISRRGYGDSFAQALRFAGGRDIVLYHPSDGLRGAAGFYRNRTALEFLEPPALVKRLAGDPDNAVLLFLWSEQDPYYPNITRAARDEGIELRIERSMVLGSEDRSLLFITAAGGKGERP